MRAAHLHRSPGFWTPCQQPLGAAVVRPGLNALRHLFWGPSLTDLVHRVPLANSGANAARQTAGIGGLAMDFQIGSGTPIFSRVTTLPPSTGWTMEMLVTVSSVSQLWLARHDANAASSGTNDRGIRLHSSGAAQAYIYDGAEKYAATTGTLTVDRLHHVAAVASGSALTCYLDGVPGAPTATSNTGFGGYGAIHLLCGISVLHRAPFLAMWGRAMSDAEVAARAAAPYDLVIPAG